MSAVAPISMQLPFPNSRNDQSQQEGNETLWHDGSLSIIKKKKWRKKNQKETLEEAKEELQVVFMTFMFTWNMYVMFILTARIMKLAARIMEQGNRNYSMSMNIPTCG